MNAKLQSLYGLKFHPFRPDVPTEALYATPATDAFIRRVELGIADGGFVLVSGDPGCGKSVALRLLAERFPDRLRSPELLPLGSRIRRRLVLDYASRDELLACLDHLLAAAGNPSLMTSELKVTLAEHAAGNYRVLMNLADELLALAADRELPRLDDKLYLEAFAQPQRPAKAAATRKR